MGRTLGSDRRVAGSDRRTVSVDRERARRARLRRLTLVLAPVAGWMWWRVLTGHNPWPEINLPPDMMFWLPAILLISVIALVLIGPMFANARSPHVVYRPEQLDTRFRDVKGLGQVLGEVHHTLQVLLDHQRLRLQMGGTPRRGVLFEGPPGTGKTYVAKAMAGEAGVPFLFVSATAFQSMWYGMTARRIRSFFRALRKAAREEGGAIGFIEEIDAIGLRRSGAESSSPGRSTAVERIVSSDTGGVVNELLIQLQSFDEPTTRMRLSGWFKERLNRLLPPHLQLRKQAPPYSNLLLIAATNRASALDPALMRPGRFDRVLHFGLPGRAARRELIDYFLESKAHEPEIDEDRPRDDIASATLGYSPASLERLFDEALLLALRDGRTALAMADVHRARLEIELGLPEPIDYPQDEAETIAVHEAGHATVAFLVGKGRKLEVLSIVKRRDALGFLAHRLQEERHTQRRSELLALVQIALGGMVAEELFFGESGTGPAGDLASATGICAELVGSLGLGGSLVSFRALDAGAFGGNLTAKVLADTKGRQAIEEILSDSKEKVTELLTQHVHIVEGLRDALLERHELIDEEILEVIHRVEAAAAGDLVVDLRGDQPVVQPAGAAEDGAGTPR